MSRNASVRSDGPLGADVCRVIVKCVLRVLGITLILTIGALNRRERTLPPRPNSRNVFRGGFRGEAPPAHSALNCPRRSLGILGFEVSLN
jgi:hypothetical protein